MYLGGERQTVGESQIRAARTLWSLPARDLGWRYQCRCGRWLYVKYRGRFYCQRCGQRIRNPDVLLVKDSETFRQRFDAAPPAKETQL